MCILAHRRDSDCPHPVIIKVAQLVCQPLHMTWPEPRGIFDDVIRSGVDCALAHRLRDEEEVVPLRQGHDVVDDGS